MLLRAPLAALTGLLWVSLAMAGAERPYMNVSLPPAERARLLVGAMTFAEKVNYLHGGCPELGYTGTACAIDRLGVPALKMNDGPQGFRDSAHPGTTTAWPCALAIAATFDADAAELWGAATAG